MANYITFLRGINISGKNRVPMAELKSLYEGLGFAGVKTYYIPFFLIDKPELEDIVAHAPQWWGSGDKSLYDNLIFMMDDISFEKLVAAVGDIKPEIEKIEPYKNAVFWTYDLKTYQKSNWWKKTATTDIKDSITIRTEGTVRKVLGENGTL